MEVTIAVVQFDIKQFAPEDNLKKAEQYIRQVAEQAQIIVFPEDFVTGPLNGNKRYADNEGYYAQYFQRLAAVYAIDIVPGSIIESEGDSLYNTTYYIDKTGNIKGKYRKVNLWLPERSYISAGSDTPVFETQFGKVGLIICWDLMFPEIFRAMVRQGVELVICPSYWCYEDAGIGMMHDASSEVKLVNALCVARAFENEVILVYANAAGRETSDALDGIEETLIGRSQITVPFKGALKLLDHNREELFLQTVDMAILHDAEQAYEIRRDVNRQ